MTQHRDIVFAPLDRDHIMERIAGGNETEVYRTDDQRFVVKIKEELGGDLASSLAQARELRAAADDFARCLGPYSLPSYYLIARDAGGDAQVVVVQPFAGAATALFDVDYAALSPADRSAVAAQLRDIIRRSLQHYRATGSMPDLYGRSSADPADRRRKRSLLALPQRVWSFLVMRNLLRSHNLMLVPGDAPRIVLVDYDPVRRSALYRAIYYLVRWALFWRDHLLIVLLRRGASIPRAPRD